MRLQHLQTLAKLRHWNLCDEEKAALLETLHALWKPREWEICCWPRCENRHRHHFWVPSLPDWIRTSVTIQFCDEHERVWVSLVQSYGGYVQKDEKTPGAMPKLALAQLGQEFNKPEFDEPAVEALIDLYNAAIGSSDGVCGHGDCHGLLMPAVEVVHCDIDGGSYYHLPLCAEHMWNSNLCDCPDRTTGLPTVDLAGPDVLELRRRRAAGDIVWMR